MKKKISEVLGIVFWILLIIMFSMTIYWMYENMFQRPCDDATNHLLTKDMYWRSVKCEKNSCNITFDSNVSDINTIALTGSMLPAVGGNDVVICLNKTPKPGDIVLVGNILHMVYKIEDDTWLITKGTNNMILDNFKFPISQINCVVGLSIR